MKHVDHCFGCKFGYALFNQGPNGRMEVLCTNSQKPENALLRRKDGWAVEEKYEGCTFGEAPEPKGGLDALFQGACSKKAALFASLDKADLLG